MMETSGPQIMSYDLFISCSRRDNAGGRITEVKQRIIGHRSS